MKHAAALKRATKHDHRRSLWVIAGGAWLWCYRCGAIRINRPTHPWVKTSEANPATRKGGLTI